MEACLYLHLVTSRGTFPEERQHPFDVEYPSLAIQIALIRNILKGLTHLKGTLLKFYLEHFIMYLSFSTQRFSLHVQLFLMMKKETLKAESTVSTYHRFVDIIFKTKVHIYLH
jgi:hypothetical protein